MRWIWIDKFLEFRSGQFARAIKNLTLAEEHLHDHFPGYPVMPASLIIEGLAQTGGILVGEAGGFAEKVVLAKIPRAEFFGVACAGDQLIYEVTLTDLRSEGAVVEAKAFLEGELLADVEIVFAHLDNSRANQIFGPKNFVFTQQLLGVLDLAKAQARAKEPPPRPAPRRQRPAPDVNGLDRLGTIAWPSPRSRSGSDDRLRWRSTSLPCSAPNAVWSSPDWASSARSGSGLDAVLVRAGRGTGGRPADPGIPGRRPAQRRRRPRSSTSTEMAMKTLALPKHQKALGKSLKYMARDIQLAVAAAELAFVDAGLGDGGVDPTRIGVDLGAGLISSELDELAPAITRGLAAARHVRLPRLGPRGRSAMIAPIWLLKYLPNMLACHISILLDCQGPSNTITEAEAASNLAIGEAARIIARGRADVMITGGADSKIHPLSLVRMSLLDQMSHWRGRARAGPAGRSTAAATAGSPARGRAS